MSNKKNKTLLILQNSAFSKSILEHLIRKFIDLEYRVIVFCEDFQVSFNNIDISCLKVVRKPLDKKYLIAIGSETIDELIFLDHNLEMYEIANAIADKHPKIEVLNKINLDLSTYKEICGPSLMRKIFSPKFFKVDKLQLLASLDAIPEIAFFELESSCGTKVYNKKSLIEYLHRCESRFVKIKMLDGSYLSHRALVAVDHLGHLEILDISHIFLVNGLAVTFDLLEDLTHESLSQINFEILKFIRKTSIRSNVFSLAVYHGEWGSSVYIESIGISPVNFISRRYTFSQMLEIACNVSAKRKVSSCNLVSLRSLDVKIFFIKSLGGVCCRFFLYYSHQELQNVIKKVKSTSEEGEVLAYLLDALSGSLSDRKTFDSHLDTFYTFNSKDNFLRIANSNDNLHSVEKFKDKILLRRVRNGSYSAFNLKNKLEEKCGSLDLILQSSYLLDNIHAEAHSLCTISHDFCYNNYFTTVMEVDADEPSDVILKRNKHDYLDLSLSRFNFIYEEERCSVLLFKIGNGFVYMPNFLNQFTLENEYKLSKSLEEGLSTSYDYLTLESTRKRDGSVQSNFLSSSEEEVKYALIYFWKSRKNLLQLHSKTFIIACCEGSLVIFERETIQQAYLELLNRFIDASLKDVYFEVIDSVADAYVNIADELFLAGYTIDINLDSLKMQELCRARGVVFGGNRGHSSIHILHEECRRIYKNRRGDRHFMIANSLRESELCKEALILLAKKWLQEKLLNTFTSEEC